MAASASRVTDSDALSELISISSAQRMGGLAYAGDVSVKQAYDFLVQEAGMLVDVRSAPEWQLTGLADLSKTPSRELALSWKLAPAMALNTQFTQEFTAAIPDRNMPVFFMCKSGGRSLDAAVAMTALDYKHCFNLPEGFADGWKAAALPWRQA